MISGEGFSPSSCPHPNFERRNSISPNGRDKESAFSLIELAIVLVILGLLVGGIMTGQSLIRAAELRSVTSDFNKYVAATNTFRDKYFALPGDMTNATAFWGTAHATAATCVTTASTNTATCNGNGDGIVVPSTGSNESFRYWQHLANAGLIEGRYSGISDGTANTYVTTPNNAPVSKLSNSLWLMWSWGILDTTDPLVFAGDYTRFYMFGMPYPNGAPESINLKPEELWNIDTKMDDGKPGTGGVVARTWANSCVSNATSAADTNTATYNLTNQSIACTVIFRGMF